MFVLFDFLAFLVQRDLKDFLIKCESKYKMQEHFLIKNISFFLKPQPQIEEYSRQ